MFIRISIVFLLLCSPSACSSNIDGVEVKSTLDRTTEMMAAVAYHECYNLSKMERWLVMEALWNRVEDNFNNNGATLEEQLLAPKQFTGLWKHNPERFKYDENDQLCVENKQMAEYILSGVRISSRRIYYWAGISDRTTIHGKFVKRKKINSKSTIHWFR